MNLWLGLLIGIKEIWSHKFRSFLTMLGIILGVASLLSMFAVTAGMARGMREYMQQIGGVEKINVNPQDVPVDQEAFAEISPGQTVADAEAVASSCKLVSYVTPGVDLKTAAVTRANELFRGTVTGAWPDFVPIYKHVIARGRNIAQLDLENAHHVCVIGRSVTAQLWPDKPNFNPVGETIGINDRPFTVIGEFELYERAEETRMRQLGIKGAKTASSPMRPSKSKHGGSSRMWNPFEIKNTTVLIPINTMFLEFKSANVVGKVDQGPSIALDRLAFQVADLERFDETIDQVRALISATHRGIEDFSVDTKQEMFDSIEQSVRNTRLTGGIIAGISLLVGGIGITNIMLASITERIREIGVRRAVGAKGRDIFIQIVVESAVIGFVGGLLGLVASLGVMQILVMISPAENVPIIEFSGALVSFSFALLIGVLSGLYPAWKASHLDPIEALRYG